MWNISFTDDWTHWISKLDESMLQIARKRIDDIEKGERRYEHLGAGLPFFKDEFGGQRYRICFKEDAAANTRMLVFIGDHKNYEKWMGYGGC